MQHLKRTDSAVYWLVAAEAKRQADGLQLIPSENIASRAVLEALATPLANKYSEGYPKRRYYEGNAVIDDIEVLAQERARAVFGLSPDWQVNVQALSGSPANMAVYFALMKPGDCFLALDLASGGHLSHGDAVNFSGRLFRAAHYGVTAEDIIDYDGLAALAAREKPRLIVAGATAYPRVIDFKRIGDIARAVGAYFMVDMAHIAGLVAAGAHPSPFLHADVVTTTTHKTLRGPRGAIIFSNAKSALVARDGLDLPAAIDKAVFPGLQGGPHDNQTAAIAVALGEAMKLAFKRYGAQVVKNAQALAVALQERGFDLVSGGTDNHLMVARCGAGRGALLARALDTAGITVNKNTIPNEPASPFYPSGIRLGTPAVTTRGMKEREMKKIAAWIAEVAEAVREYDPPADAKAHRVFLVECGEAFSRNAVLARVRREVGALCRKFPCGR